MSQAPTQAPPTLPPSTPVAQPVSVPSFPSTIELRDAARAQPPRPGFFQAVGDAASSEWVGSWLLRQSARTGFSYDPTFDLNDETLKKLTEGLPEDTWSAFGDAVSMDHAARIRDQMLEVTESRERLARLGWQGVGLRIAASILDPVGIAAGFATGGAGYMVKGGRVARMIRTGLAVGGSEMAIEGYLTTQDPERDVSDVLWAGAGGLVFGGAADLLAGGDISRAARKLRKDVEYGEILAAGPGFTGEGGAIPTAGRRVDLTDEGRAYFREQISAQEQGKHIDDLIQRSGLDPVEDADQIAEIRALPPEEALNRFTIPKGPGVAVDAPVSYVPEGAAVNLKNPDSPDVPPPFPPTLKAGDFDPTPIGAARAAYAKIRFGFSAILGRSKSDRLVEAGNKLVTDPLAKVGGVASRDAADTWVARKMRGFEARYSSAYIPNMKAWARANKRNPAIDMTAEEDFARQVALARRYPSGLYTRDKHVNAVADMERKLYKEIYDIGHRHAVEGFDLFEHSDTYLPVKWNTARVSAASGKYADEIDDWFYDAVMSDARSDTITPEKARKIGRGLRERLVELNQWSDMDRNLNLSGAKSDIIEEVLNENGVDAETIKDVLYGLGRPKNPDAGKITPAKRRTILNPNFARKMSDGSTLAVTDLIDTNARRLFESYARQVVGAAASTQVYRSMGVKDFAALKKLIGEEMDQVHKIPKPEIDRKLALLEMADKHVRGIPLTHQSGTGTFLRRLRSINNLMMSGGFGSAALAETGNAVTLANLRAMYQQIPEFRKILLRARDGTWDSGIANDIEALTGLGSEGMTNSFMRRMDDEMDPHAQAGNRFDFALNQANKLGSKLSMLAPIDRISRLGIGMVTAQRFVDLALGGRPMSVKRMASIGLSETDGNRIIDAMKAEHAAQRGIVTERGAAGRKLNRLHIDKWQDQQAASMYVSAIDRSARLAIQSNSIGSLHPWMAKSEVGKSFFQFRSFMIQAWEKQFLHRIQVRDVEAFQSAAAVTFVSGLVYVAQQQALSVGRPDREEFLKERLSDKAIAAAAFQRSGWSSLLPTGIDTAMRLGQRDTIFNYGNSGLNRAVSLDANPTSYNINQAFRGVGGAIGAATQGDEDFGQQDARAMMMLLPFRNVMGVRNVIEAIAQQLPEE